MLNEYLSFGQAKIVVKAQSEAELAECLAKARQLGVNCFENVSEGAKGPPVCQCLALGPDRSSRIDQISGRLKLM